MGTIRVVIADDDSRVGEALREVLSAHPDFEVHAVVGTGEEAAELAGAADKGAGVKLDDIVTKVTLGVMQATTGMVGQNLGARQFGRIRRTVSYAWLVSLAFYAA